MKDLFVRICSIILMFTLVVSFSAACSKVPTEINATEVLQSLLSKVKYSDELNKVGDNANLYFPDLPEKSTIDFYTVGGYFADEVALLTLENEEDADKAENIVKSHVKELREQFLDYVPKEVGKIDKAVIINSGKYLFLCITDDYKTAKEILSDKGTEKNIEKSETDKNIEKSETEKDPIITAPPKKVEPAYPTLTSKSGTYQKYNGAAIRFDNAAFELYNYVDSTAKSYADIVNKTASTLKGTTTVYDIAIPTAIGVVMPDNIKEKINGCDNQEKAISKIYDKLSADVKKVNCYDNMMKHRDEYLYFRTDFHWNGKGAFYAYEAFCNTKGIKAIPLNERTEKKFDGFLGELYWNNSGKDAAIGNTPDTVEAYLPKSQNATMKFTDKKGNTYPWAIILDVTNYKSSMKYCTFAGADNPLTVFENPDVSDGSVCIIVKESFGNAMLPFLVDHYSTIYEIDYRYWNGDLTNFAMEKNADDLIFANNLSMIRSNYLVGKLAGIVR